MTNILNGNKVAALNKVLSPKGRRGDAASVYAPVTIEEIFDCNTIEVANDILNNLAAELGCAVAALGVTVPDILACNTSNWQAFIAKLNGNKSIFSNMSKRGDLAGIPVPGKPSSLPIAFGADSLASYSSQRCAGRCY